MDEAAEEGDPWAEVDGGENSAVITGVDAQLVQPAMRAAEDEGRAEISIDYAAVEAVADVPWDALEVLSVDDAAPAAHRHPATEDPAAKRARVVATPLLLDPIQPLSVSAAHVVRSLRTAERNDVLAAIKSRHMIDSGYQPPPW